jgi:hypothetical protein
MYINYHVCIYLLAIQEHCYLQQLADTENQVNKENSETIPNGQMKAAGGAVGVVLLVIAVITQ